MTGFNRVVVAGNLTRDPELQHGANGNSWVRARMAINRQYMGKDNVPKEEVTFVDISFFGKSAETFSRYLKKGDPVLCEGRLNSYQWEDDKGEKRSKVSIAGERFRFMPRRGKEETRGMDGIELDS